MQGECHAASAYAALEAIAQIITRRPEPEACSERARFCAEALARHLISLILTASDANLAGRHSAAISLFRNMEDALDCFAAVTLVEGAAEEWAKDQLKPSEAAKRCEPMLGEVVLVTGEKATDYRKNLRNYFNKLAHCTPYLTDWDLFPEFDTDSVQKLASAQASEGIRARLRVNHGQRILHENAQRIAGYLVAHIIEFSHWVAEGYAGFLQGEPQLGERLRETVTNLKKTLSEYGPVYLEEMPPEVKNPVIQHPRDPDLVMRLDYPSGKP